MGKDSLVSQFELAEARAELSDFAIGKGEYFLPDREYGEHWVLGSWKQEIVPLLRKYEEVIVNEKLRSMLSELLKDSSIDLRQKINFVLYHLSTYYFLKKENNFTLDAFQECENSVVDLIKTASISYNADELVKLKYAVRLIQNRGGLLGYELVP